MNIKLLFLSLIILFLVGCVDSASVRYNDSSPDRYYRNGPPPHAPAHGYRSKYRDHDMIYDSGIGAYIIVGMPDYYFDNNFYFRFRDGHWQISASLGDRWRDTNRYSVPRKLYQSKYKKSKHHKEHHGKGKDKHKKWDED